MRLAGSLAVFALSTCLTPALGQVERPGMELAKGASRTVSTGAITLGPAEVAKQPVLNGLPDRWAPATGARTGESRRPLPFGSDELQLRGEIATQVAPLFLLPMEASRPAKVKLSYLSAVSVLPEVSRLSVSVNNQPIGERYLNATVQPKDLTFDIPPGLLQAGYNAVRITARHAHRVDCSREASYELWTQIIPEQSGILLTAGPSEIKDLRDLPATRQTAAGANRIRVRSPAAMDAETLRQVARAVQATVLVGRFARPVVEINPEESGGAGIDLIVGTDAVVRGIGEKPAPGAGPRIHVSHDARTNRVLLMITGATREEVISALGQLEATAVASDKLQGSPAGLQALAAQKGALVQGGDTVRIAALGFDTQRFAGRYYRQSGLLRMPADFYPGDYGRMTLALDGAYGPQLASASKLNVRVNGAIVSTVPLTKSAGDTLRQRTAYLQLSAFKPGVNSVVIEADTVTASDRDCSATSQMGQRDRWLLSNTSELTVPRLARIASLPNLSPLMSGGLSERDGVQIYIPNPNIETTEAALGFIAKTAAVSGQMVSASLTFEQVELKSSHIVTIGALADIPPALLSASGLSVEALRRAWSEEVPGEPQAEALQQPVRVAAVGSEISFEPQPNAAAQPIVRRSIMNTSSSDPIKPALVQDTSPVDPFPRAGWIEPLQKLRDVGEETLDHVVSWTTSVKGEFLRFYNARFGQQDETAQLASADEIVTPSTTLVVSERAAPKALQNGWQTQVLPEVSSSTVIVGPSAASLRDGMSEFLASGLWQQMSGRTVAYDVSAAAVRSVEAETTWFIPTQPTTPGNLRLIVAAWLSNNVQVYLAFLFVAIMLLTAVSYRLVRSSGVRAP